MYLLTSPIVFSTLHLLSLHLSLFFSLLDVYSFYLELYAAELDDVVLFQLILLLHVAVCDVTHN